MVLTFRHDLTAKRTRIFEKQYEKALRNEDEEKDYILSKRLAVWLYVDGKLAGEAYGIIVKEDDEDIEDTVGRPNDIYCYSTTILPAFRGKGLGKILKAYWLGYVWAKYPGRIIIGHATSPAMVKINKQFGARFLGSHEKWYGTDRVAHFYEIVPSDERVRA